MAEIIPSNIYSNYEEKKNEIVLDACGDLRSCGDLILSKP